MVRVVETGPMRFWHYFNKNDDGAALTTVSTGSYSLSRRLATAIASLSGLEHELFYAAAA